MSAPVSDWFIQGGIGSRFLVAVLAGPFVVVGAAVFSLGYLVRYVLTGRRPYDLSPPQEDLQAELIRAVLDRPETLIH